MRLSPLLDPHRWIYWVSLGRLIPPGAHPPGDRYLHQRQHWVHPCICRPRWLFDPLAYLEILSHHPYPSRPLRPLPTDLDLLHPSGRFQRRVFYPGFLSPWRFRNLCGRGCPARLPGKLLGKRGFPCRGSFTLFHR